MRDGCHRQHVKTIERRLRKKDMKFNFKKISAIATSALMFGMTMGVAAAASYPAPFVVGGAADVAIVYGTGSGVSDLDQVQGYNINLDLQSYMSTSGGTTDITVGETYPLFTGSSGGRIYMNDSLNSQRSTLTDTELPTVLADGTFEGDETRDFTQIIKVGSTPILEFGNHPTSDDDPVVAFSTGTSTSSVMYNLTITFDGAVNFTHSDSIGESMTIFGREYTVGAGTTTTKLYLYESSETVGLSIGGADPSSATITLEGSTYTVELISATDTTATIKVTDSSGTSQSKEITEDNSKKVQGVDIAVDLADEDTATNRLLAQITIGANKVLLQSGSKIKEGSDEDSIDGTLVTRSGASWAVATGFTIGIVPDDSDVDAITVGGSFVDPAFGTLKLDFSGLHSDDDRETIIINPAGGDKATIEMTTHSGVTKKVNWFYNDSVTARLADSGDSGNDAIHVMEGEKINITQYVMVGNEDEGYLLELYDFDNDTDDLDDDIIFRDAFNPTDTFSVTGITSEGAGELIVGGKTFDVTYVDESAEGADYVILNYPDTTTQWADLVIYPTIETAKGAKVAFYEPKTITLTNPTGNSATDLVNLYFPDGNGYSYLKFAYDGEGDSANWTITPYPDGVAGTAVMHNTTATEDDDFSIGQLKYRFTSDGTDNVTTLYLVEAAETNAQTLPGIIIIEEEDDNNQYQAIIVEMDDKTASNELAGPYEAETTWNDNAANTDWNEIQMEVTDDDVYASYDLWGTLMSVDKSDTDQYKLTVSYPDEQVHAKVYFAEESASITAGTTAGGTAQIGNVVFKDTESSSYSTKNVIVVGGSCINSAAAALVGGAYCTADWTTATDVGTGEFLIKGYSSSTVTSKFALLVAGYSATDTVNAATYLRNKKPDTSKAWKGTTSTAAATEITAA